MKKVLIITYYWPPAGGAGVQRWLKFAKYLPENGWQPIIYTPENPESPANDESLFADVPKEATVIKQPIWEPFEIYKRLTGKPVESKFNAGFLEEEKGNSFMTKLSVWVRGNFFIPDAKRFWIKPSVRFLKHYLQENKIDIIVSTGPPHSMHLIANKLHQSTGIPWIADFRDPWTQIDFYSKLRLTKASDKKHKRLEKMVLQNATQLVVVGNTMARDFAKIVNKPSEIITNGFDKTDADAQGAGSIPTEFSVVHIGSMNADRNHKAFWQALRNCIDSVNGFENDFRLVLVGKNDLSVLSSLKEYNLDTYTRIINYVQHDKVMQMERQAAILYLPLNNTPNAKGILTGKFFEYLASQRPIFAVGPTDGDLAAILNDTSSGMISDFDDVETMQEHLEMFYSAFKNKTLMTKGRNIEKYERSELTKKMVKLFDKLV